MSDSVTESKEARKEEAADVAKAVEAAIIETATVNEAKVEEIATKAYVEEEERDPFAEFAGIKAKEMREINSFRDRGVLPCPFGHELQDSQQPGKCKVCGKERKEAWKALVMTCKQPECGWDTCYPCLVVRVKQAKLLNDAVAKEIPKAPVPFLITVEDKDSRQRIPLVQLTTVNKIQYWSDSNGLIAFHEPDLMDTEVWFNVFSHGFEMEKDFFGFAGVKLIPKLNGTATIRMKRLNAAWRQFRLTGQGIYRDSQLVNYPYIPLAQPSLNAQVMGQDSVLSAKYKEKLYWFWGDTERASYPLGHFGVAGATSPIVRSGPVDYKYFTDEHGFSKPLCAGLGEGLHWAESVMVLKEDGQEKLVARVSSQKGFTPSYAWNLCVFNDEKEIFESVVKWDIQEWHDIAHPHKVKVNGVEYFYLWANWRVKAEMKSVSDLSSYEAWTCLAGNGSINNPIDRDENGRVKWRWQAGAVRLTQEKIKLLLGRAEDPLRPSENWTHFLDIETGAPVALGRGNMGYHHKQEKWIWIFAGKPGEVWYAEGDSPTGPWVWAQRVVQHTDYNFYNPVRHSWFDDWDSICFEGTYVSSFSNAKEKTPRYDYNQIMYKLFLEGYWCWLMLPVAYYCRRGRILTGWTVQPGDDELVFFAFRHTFPADKRKKPEGTIPFWQDDARISTKECGGDPLMYAVAADDEKFPFTTPLYEYENEGKFTYSTNPNLPNLPKRAEKPVCRVWHNPFSFDTLDPAAEGMYQ